MYRQRCGLQAAIMPRRKSRTGTPLPVLLASCVYLIISQNVQHSQGYPCPETYNPAEHMIHTLAGSDGNSRRVVRHICDRFLVSDYAKEVELQIDFQHQVGAVYDVSSHLQYVVKTLLISSE